MRHFSFLCAGVLLLSACTPAPPVEQSRGVLWQRYAHQPIDKLLLAWGAPAAETKLTDGSRLVSYRRAVTFDAASPYENTSGCEASFLAPPPGFTIENVALKGNPAECFALAQNGPGYVRNYYVPPPPPPLFYPGGFYR
jgi:hypothetical protein